MTLKKANGDLKLNYTLAMLGVVAGIVLAVHPCIDLIREAIAPWSDTPKQVTDLSKKFGDWETSSANRNKAVDAKLDAIVAVLRAKVNYSGYEADGMADDISSMTNSTPVAEHHGHRS